MRRFYGESADRPTLNWVKSKLVFFTQFGSLLFSGLPDSTGELDNTVFNKVLRILAQLCVLEKGEAADGAGGERVLVCDSPTGGPGQRQRPIDQDSNFRASCSAGQVKVPSLRKTCN